MWFKKKSVLQAEGNYNSNTAYDGTDWRTNGNDNNWPVSSTLPSAADAGKYFYLPALGRYTIGMLFNVGNEGYYWSSSAFSWYSGRAYGLYFSHNSIQVRGTYYRYNGFRVGGFE